MFVPESREVICDYFLKKIFPSKDIRSRDSYAIEKITVDIDGIISQLLIRGDSTSDNCFDDVQYCLGGEKINGGFSSFESNVRLMQIVRYAKMIDKIFNTDWTSELTKELINFIKKNEQSFSRPYHYMELPDYLPLLKNLVKSYKICEKQVLKDRVDFYGKEQARRKQFYNQHNNFREQQIVDPNQLLDNTTTHESSDNNEQGLQLEAK